MAAFAGAKFAIGTPFAGKGGLACLAAARRLRALPIYRAAMLSPALPIGALVTAVRTDVPIEPAPGTTEEPDRNADGFAAAGTLALPPD